MLGKLKVFISSVQKEFAHEREQLYQYFCDDAFLNTFLEPVLFEKLPAATHAPDKIYIDEVSTSDVYIGLLGQEYGYENEQGISPTEQEYNHACKMGVPRFIFIKGGNDIKRHPKEEAFIRKVGEDVSRKRFHTMEELKQEVNKACFTLLQQKGLFNHQGFDSSVQPNASLSDLDESKIQEFVRMAGEKRGFPLPSGSSPEKVLAHLNMIATEGIKSSALLVFGKKPQQFFPSATVKCAHFHGTRVEKPIPDHKVFGGDVFEQVDKAVDFVLSKISTSVGLRTDSAQAPVQYEIPRPVIAEAMVNAIAHRDYNSNASVQVMLFSDRLEIFNPGSLVPQLNIQKLKTDHASYPTNPALAEAMYQVGYIERFGTGTGEILRLSKEANLKEPFFDLDEGFKVILWRPVSQIPHQYPTSTPPVPDKHRTSAGQVPDKYRTSEVEKLVSVVSGEMKASEIQSTLNLKHRETFRDNYLNPSINAGLVEPTIPDKPNSPKQKYRLTASGLQIQQEIKNSL